MTHVMPETRLANIQFRTTDTFDEVRGHIEKLMDEAAQTLLDHGVAEDVAAMLRTDPLKAETALRDAIHRLACTVLSGAFEQLDDDAPSLEVADTSYRRMDASPGHALTLFGPIMFNRARYRPTSGQGACFVPAEARLELTASGFTPAAACLSMALMSSLTARESADVWDRFCGAGPATSTLVRLSATAGQCLEAYSEDVLRDLRAQEDAPSEAVTLHTSIDGVMMRMNAETAGEDVVEEAGWREASCGVVSLLDVDGNKLQSRFFGRLPEEGKHSLKAQLRNEVFYWLARKPDLKLVISADGAKDNWAFSESLKPDVEVLDFWHATGYLKLAADAAFGSDEEASTKWYKDKRHILRHDPKGVGKVIDALRHLLRKEKGRSEIERALGYFRNNRRRMNYDHLAKAGYPIGSGQVEAANKVLVTSRMKRSGQSWGREGGQGVLAFRALLKSDRFDRAWSMLVPLMSRSRQDWKTVNQTANDNRKLSIAA